MLNNKKTKSIKKSETVFVGLSGGVDSAVSAYLLKKDGFNVVGVFIKTWQPDFIECTWKEDRRDAMRVAAHLDIPFITMDLEKEYKKNVADYMIEEYKKGRTPNPDIMCNKEIKFGGFLKKSLEMGADFVATGHYARTNDKFQLLKAKDAGKEQSYFLWAVDKEKLAKIIFPIGGLEKPEVRKIAKKAGLPNAEKKDSQGICMLGDISIKDFLSHYIDVKEGKVLNTEGEEIGTHNGAVFLTIGERHGFTITKKTPEDDRMYVVSKDLKANTITVGTEKDLKMEGGLVRKEVTLEKTNWIWDEPQKGKIYDAQIRYHQDLQKASVEKTGNSWKVIFKNPQTAASGQSVVIYNGLVCLGGGIVV